MPFPQDASQGQGGNSVDPRQIMQAIMARMAQQRGGMPAPPQNATPPGGMPQMPGTPQPGGMPGAAGPPQQAQAQPQGQMGPGTQMPFSQRAPNPPTPSGGAISRIMGLVNQHEQKDHNKKAALAENYMLQINSLLASGDPKDQEKASLILSDPKIQKILKTGLEYVPLEEEVPPEAQGVQAAMQKIMGKGQQAKPQMRPILPKPSQERQEALNLARQKTATSAAEAGKYEAEGGKATSEAAAATVKAEADRVKAEADVIKLKADAENARQQGDLYSQQAKDAKDLSPGKVREAEAHAREMDALARWHDAQAKFLAKGGKMPGSALQSQIKSARGDMVSLLRGYMSDNKDAAKAVTKDTGYIFGPKSALLKDQEETSKKSKDLSRAIAWFDGEGTSSVTEGKLSLPEAVSKAYRMAGIEAPIPTKSPNDGEANSTDDEIMKLLGTN